MYVKFQYVDTSNCFHILNSTKPTPSIGISIPPTKKYKDQNKLNDPNGRIEKSKNLGVKFRTGVGYGNDVKEKLDYQIGKNSHTHVWKNGVLKTQNGFLRKPVDETDSEEKIDGQSNSGNGVQTKCSTKWRNDVKEAQNGFLRKPVDKTESEEKVDGKWSSLNVVQTNCSKKWCKDVKETQNGVLKTQNGVFRKPVDRTENNKKNGGQLGSGNAMEKVQTKGSKKWARYGGCIPVMLEALEKVSNLDEALKPWEKSLTKKERTIILKEQVEWHRAMEIFEWFKRRGCHELNVIHYNIILRILGKSQRWGEIERLLGEMRERRVEPINSTYGTLIDVYSKGGRREQAMEWLNLMNERGMVPDEVTMGIVVQMYKMAGEFKKAEEFLKKWSLCKCQGEERINGGPRSGIRVNGSSGSSVCLSSHTYNNLIDTYGKAGQVKEAYETFHQMLREGILPTTVTFNTMIHMCGNNGRMEEVASLMRKMKGLQCHPDTRTYNILISLHAKHDNIEMAATYFKIMKDASLEPDAVTYRTLLYAFSIRNMVSEAEKLILEMDKKDLQIDEFTQSALTRMYLEAGMVEKSWSWFQRFHLAGKMYSECYSANIDAFGERGHILEAERAFNCCREGKRLTVLEFNVMIKAYGISKKYNEACYLFDSMEKHGLSPDRCSYSSLIQMLAGADLPLKAASYVRKMQEAGLVDDCIPYCAVISSFVKVGQLEMAVSLFDEMIAFDVEPDVVVYGVLINAFADMGSVKDATKYLVEMRDSGLEANVVIYTSLIKLYTKVGYLREAQETFEMLQSFEAGADVYSSNCMIDLYSERSMVRQAEEIFEHLKQKGNANEFSYAMMLCMYRRNGMFKEAIQNARKMKELGLLTDLLSYNNVLGLCATDGRYKEALATYKEMLSSAIQPDDSTFKSLGIVLLKCGVPKEAIGKLESMRKKDPQSGVQEWTSALSSIIGMLDTDCPDSKDA
ncbi:pentatricopeptide repeat-containing protein At3g23020 [Solanum dulcamara]|uniref:pentatricopeptide repeat-containing protein At3g23020 n=1 Tax=Solanum dulcamara TaxID=45834 RepID=UPI0024852630|nr:pentatricopeptide repeat-containing protein At3g23020 [Solanum dulcamara]